MKKDLGALVLASLLTSAGCWVHIPEDGDPSASEAEPCWNHNSCRAGCYCAGSVCKQSGTCSRDYDCAIGFSCDRGRRTCVPRQEVAPPPVSEPPVSQPPPSEPPPPPSTGGGKCGDGGVQSCGHRCRFDQECGLDARCVDGSCQHACTSGCGTGDTCREGFCQPDNQAGGMCVYAAMCSAGASCISGYCHPACQSSSDCPNKADACVSGICRPDDGPLDPCTASSQCPAANSCVDGLCRPACTCDADCAATWWGPTSVCRRGFCSSPAE